MMRGNHKLCSLKDIAVVGIFFSLLLVYCDGACALFFHDQ
jgi:hypothetical protein